MPQIFQVLRCYKCFVFQVHQTKKSNKFECKMCGEKQSIKRHYGLGNGQECRKHVQKLNGIRGEMDNSKSSQSISTDDENDNVSNVMPIVQTLIKKPSKWSEYVEKDVENTENSDDDNNMFHNNTNVVLELPKKHCKIGKSFKRNQSTKTCSDPVPSGEDYVSPSRALQEHVISSGSAQISNFKNSTFIPPIKKEANLHSDLESSSHSSKWADLDNESTNDKFNSEQKENSHNQTNNVNRKTYEPPEINKNSKWAKFAEVTVNNEENELEEPTINKSNFKNEPNTIFSLCEDEDIADYLTI